MSWPSVPNSKVDLPSSVKELEVMVRSVALDTAVAVSSEVEKVLPALVDAEKNIVSSVNKVSHCLPAGFSLFGWVSLLKNYLYKKSSVLSSTPPPDTLTKTVSEVVPVPDVKLDPVHPKVTSSEEPQ